MFRPQEGQYKNHTKEHAIIIGGTAWIKPRNVLWRNNETRSHNHYCRGKAVRIKYYECVSVALGIQHAMRRRRILPLASLALSYFSTISHKRHDFRWGGIYWTFSSTLVRNTSHSTKNSARYYEKFAYVFNFNQILIFWAHSEKILISNFMKSRPVEAELFHVDIRTDRQAQFSIWK